MTVVVRRIGKLKLRRPLHFHILATKDGYELIGDEVKELKVQGKTLNSALKKLELTMIMLLTLDGSSMNQDRLEAVTLLLYGNLHDGDIGGLKDLTGAGGGGFNVQNT